MLSSWRAGGGIHFHTNDKSDFSISKQILIIWCKVTTIQHYKSFINLLWLICRDCVYISALSARSHKQLPSHYYIWKK